MSNITSAGNLTINTPLSVGGNSILGRNISNALTCNASSNFNANLTISGNISQTNGTFRSGTGGIISNGDVLINATQKLTTGTGLTSINGLSQANDIVKILSGKSIYITDAALTNYISMYHAGIGLAPYIDYTGGINFRNSGSTTSLIISSKNIQVTFNYILNTTGISNNTNPIINNSTFTQNSVLNAIAGVKNSSHIWMLADGAESIYFTTDGNPVSTNNCVGRLFASSTQMYFDYYSNFTFRDSSLADGTNNNLLNLNLSNSTFYGPFTTKGVKNNTNAITNNSTLS